MMPFSKLELFSYIGSLLLLGLHGVRNHRYAWSTKKAQTLVRLSELLTCEQYELIGTFLHLVTPAEEQELSGNRLCKILPLHNYIKSRCFDLYQPNRQLSIDERMVKSKARTHFRQYIRNKPTKWGFKYWVLADITGYTVDFDLYLGRATQSSGKGLSYDVVRHLVQPFLFQGYELYCDNFYTSPTLLEDLLQCEIVATGTLNTNRKEVPKEVPAMKMYVDSLPRGTGYYFRATGSNITYCVWRDTKTVTLASTAYPAHSEKTVERRVKDPVTGTSKTENVPCPLMLEKYNKYMGGVDKSDQLISYHKISRRTVKYWKTTFFHLIDIAAVNSHILYNFIQLQKSEKPMSENQFRDKLVLEIISLYGTEKRPSKVSKRRVTTCKVHHGSKLYPANQKAKCLYCHLHNAKNFTQRKCPDCNLVPALCQTVERDCHSAWHSDTFAVVRKLWYEHRSHATSLHVASSSTSGCSSTRGHRGMSESRSSQEVSSTSQEACSTSRGRGRPRGSINRSKRRGSYRNRK